MAAMMNTLPIQSSFKPCGQKSSGQRRALVCRAESRDEGVWTKVAVPLLAVGLAATVLVNEPAPANAGVQMEQPKLKRLRQFQKREQLPEDQVAQENPSGGGGGGFSFSAPSLPSPSLPTSIPFPSLPEVNTSGGIDPRSIALPGAVAAIAAAGYAAYSLDGGFRSMIRESLVKDSTGYAGYEETIKGDGSFPYRGPAVTGTKKVGSKAPMKKSVKGTKKVVKGKTGKGGVLGGLFN